MNPLVTIILRVFGFFSLVAVLVTSLALIIGSSVYIYFLSEIPSIKNISNIKSDEPLRVYTVEGELIQEFGDKRRIPLPYAKFPKTLVNAFISAEDDRFFEHSGVDYKGMSRAFINMVRTGTRGQGGSTITMQLARNLFLTKKKTFKRKLLEIFLAFKIERELTKPQIMERYLNYIYLGNRSYGVQAASNVYYGVNLSQLSLAQIAMIAGLPKAPSRYNPVINPKRALLRRNYVLGRMLDLGHVTKEQYQKAKDEEISSDRHSLLVNVEGHYIAEMVRQKAKKMYKRRTYSDGYNIYTTIISKHQKALTRALRKGIMQYDRRHGYRGPVLRKAMPVNPSLKYIENRLVDYQDIGGLESGVVTSVQGKTVNASLKDGIDIVIPWKGIVWARKYEGELRLGPRIKSAKEVLQRGDVIYVETMENNQRWLAQIPNVSAAAVAVNPKNGAITALVGGFDYFLSKFNRVTQAYRQPGSSFKPFIYASALEKGYTPASLFNDAPLVLKSDYLESDWKPGNDDGRTLGLLRMRRALYLSRNLVAIRILQTVTVGFAHKFAEKFGFPRKQLERNLSFALGTSVVSPLQLATGYASFANGGFKVKAHFITKIVQKTRNKEGIASVVRFQEKPLTACPKCDPATGNKQLKDAIPAKRIISEQIAYQMTSMLKDVIKKGTGRGAKVLGRPDIAGKTGTTNKQKDAWFSGYSKNMVVTVWVGFDQVKTLGYKEYGGTAALPIWVEFMKVILKNQPVWEPRLPKDMVILSIDKKTGDLAAPYSKERIMESFRTQYQPTKISQVDSDDTGQDNPYEDDNHDLETNTSKKPNTKKTAEDQTTPSRPSSDNHDKDIVARTLKEDPIDRHTKPENKKRGFRPSQEEDNPYEDLEDDF